jgi:hypothetical protein
MSWLFTGIRAPSTLGTFLRARSPSVTSASSTRSPPQLLVNLAGHMPLLRDAGQICFVDVDDTVDLRLRQAGRSRACSCGSFALKCFSL